MREESNNLSDITHLKMCGVYLSIKIYIYILYIQSVWYTGPVFSQVPNYTSVDKAFLKICITIIIKTNKQKNGFSVHLAIIKFLGARNSIVFMSPAVLTALFCILS